MRKSGFASFALLIFAMPSIYAQTLMSKPTSSVQFDRNGNLVIATFTYRVPLQPPVLGSLPGRPYSAEEMSQQRQTLPDNTQIRRNTLVGKFYRDSAGRTRSEQYLPPSPTLKQAWVPMAPEIFDPVEGCVYYLDVANKTAHRVEVPQPIKVLTPPQGLVFPMAAPMTMTVTSGGGLSARPETSSELLGTQEIEGVPALGRRTTTTYAPGMIGNDQPISITVETWISQELNAVITSKTSDPRQGDRIQSLFNISRQEPSAALFQVPKGYQVITETAPFNITIKGPSTAK